MKKFLTNIGFFNSDLYIVFGFSIIKGKILKFLVKKKLLTYIWEFRHITRVQIVIFRHYMITIQN